VREIFALYQRHRSLAALVNELARRGWKTKSRTSQRGIRHTGRAFTKASLAHLLTNITYAGRINYRGTVYKAEHPAIIDPAVWEDLNKEFQARERPKPTPSKREQNALLAGLLFCKSCDRPMMATYSVKKGRRYRYYVCHSALRQGWRACPTKSVSATRIEESLVSQLLVRLSREDTRRALRLTDHDWQAFLHEPEGLIPTLVESVRYEGRSGTVSVALRTLNGLRRQVHA
jgi:site-specific DNA recombinase